MALTAIKPNEQLIDMDKVSPFWTWNPTFQHIRKLLFESDYPRWLWNTMFIASCATFISLDHRGRLDEAVGSFEAYEAVLSESAL